MPALCLMLALLASSLYAQPPKSERLPWIEETPKGYLNDYFVGIGTSDSSEATAHEQALFNALLRIQQSREIVVTASQRDSIYQTQSLRDGKQSVELVRKTAREIAVDGRSTTINGLIEEERYHELEGTSHTVWSLVKIPKKNSIESPPNKFSPIWRSALVPGWGQFYKGQKTKGWLIISSEAVLIPSGFIFQNLMLTAHNDAQNARTQALRDYYNDQASLYQNISLGVLIAAGAIYVFNVIDALTSEGAKIYVEIPRMNDQDYNIRSLQLVQVSISLQW